MINHPFLSNVIFKCKQVDHELKIHFNVYTPHGLYKRQVIQIFYWNFSGIEVLTILTLIFFLLCLLFTDWHLYQFF